MSEIFWNAWSSETANGGIEYLFDAMLLKKETPFPDHIIVPEFKDNEKIVLVSHIPAKFKKEHNDMLLKIVSKVISLIPESSNKILLLFSENAELTEIWKKTYPFCKLLSEDAYIEFKKPVKEYSPFSTVQPKPDYLPSWYLPYELYSADQIIPLMPFMPSFTFKVHGIISSFFYFLPTKIKNEILIQKTQDARTKAFMEIFLLLLPKITLSGVLYQGLNNFSVFGNDPASVDAFASALVSIKASSVPTTKYCRKNKIGTGDLLKIHVQGERFKKPIVNEISSNKKRFELYFDPVKCTMCKICIDLCPCTSIFAKDNQLFYVKNNCIQCGYCLSICPKDAINEI